MSNGQTGLYWSYSMCCIQKEAVAVMPTTVFLLLAPSGHWGHHLSLMMYGVKMSEEAHVWLPAVCQMVEQVYIDHNPCAVFKKRLTLWCPSLFSCCLFLVDTEAIICHWWYMESKWVKKPMYGYQQYVKWSNRSILIIIHVLSSKKGSRCDAHHWFFLLLAPSGHWGHHLSLMM
jgi:hypothetical protein